MVIYGLDFSGAIDAGRKTWLTRATIRDSVTHVEAVARAGAFTGAGLALQECLRGLREFVARQTDAAFGCDFPFGLPRSLVSTAATWEEFILGFPLECAGPEDFRQRCNRRSNGRELKRHSDLAQRTPWSPYNLRLYRQSYYGLADLLAPLVRSRAARVLPMQQMESGKPCLLEVCPSSRLKRLKLGRPYKRPGEGGTAARAEILDQLLATGALVLGSAELRATIITDADGDALDSVIAAWVTADAIHDPDVLFPELHETEMLEGHVYA